MGALDYGLSGLATKKGRQKQGSFLSNLFNGTPAQHEQRSTLRPDQEALYEQMQRAAQERGAGGAFGESADYYRDLLSNNSQDMDAFAAPEIRRFNEQTIPGLSEQFAGMGSGGLDSSGFRNAAVGAGTDLSERLGAIRAQLRQQGAQGLQSIGQQGLGNFSQDVETQAGSQGLLSQAAPLIGTAIGAFGGPVGAAAGGAVGNWLSSSMKGKSSPYGGSNGLPSRDQIQNYKPSSFQLPQFGQR